MSKVIGIFSDFLDLDQIPLNDISKWIKKPPLNFTLENYIANRIYYPQVAPISSTDLEIDMAILKEVLRVKGDSSFLNQTLRKIIIPQSFFQFLPDIKKLVWIFVDAFLSNQKLSSDVYTVVLKTNSEKVIGTLLRPRFLSPAGNIKISFAKHNFLIKKGNLVVFPCDKHCLINYQLSSGNLLGKNEGAVEIDGGILGIMIDGR